MNVKALANIVTSKFGRAGLIASKHSPTLMFGAGVVGVVTTVVLASRATLKLEEVLEETQKTSTTIQEITHPDYSDDDKKRDLALLYVKTAFKVVKLYAPAIGVGIVSVGALTGSHIVLTRRNMGLTAAYAALDKGFKDYRARVVKELGPEKDREFRYEMIEKEILEETVEGPVVKTVKRPSANNGRSIYARVFDEVTSMNWQRAPGYNQLFISAQQQYANDKLRANGHVFLNEVLDSLGLERSSAGAVVGWIKDSDGDGYIDFGVFHGDRIMGEAFVNGDEKSVLLDFNVDGVIYDKI